MSDYLALQKGIIYGPIASRRFGISLGINLSPTDKKLCSLNCAYCQYGPTVNLQATAEGVPLPSIDEVILAMEQALQRETHLDQITFSGNGEPTVHPNFPEIVDRLVEFRNRWTRSSRTAVLSNGTTLGSAEVRDALSKLDRPVIKIDCGQADTFLRYNRPASGITYDTILDGARQLGGFLSETLIAAGRGGNSTPEERAAWMEVIRDLKPREAHIYSMDRPPALATLKPVAREMLDKWAREATEITGVPVRAF